MRIIAGLHKGRRLAAPDGRIARPTGDRVREALFNILAHGLDVELEDARVVDAFAGTGALGLEALSRGAAHASFVENHRDSLTALTANIQTLREEGRTTLVRTDATKLPLASSPCTLAFLDPPYNANLAPLCLGALARQGWLAPKAIGVVEVAADEAFTAPEGFTILEERGYGAARVVFVRYAS